MLNLTIKTPLSSPETISLIVFKSFTIYITKIPVTEALIWMLSSDTVIKMWCNMWFNKCLFLQSDIESNVQALGMSKSEVL